MPSVVHRLTRNKPGKMTIIDYSLIAVLTAYSTFQILIVLGGHSIVSSLLTAG